ncbi:MAG: hypothetical protein GQ557_01410 [Mycoplasmataceae bacterium]|nr:hypothetical protein [Mycoplasmataceae bacterium]
MEGYRQIVIENLSKALTMAENFGEIQTKFDIEKPISHIGEYDMAIQMLNMTTSEEIEISKEEFKQYVMDDWYWSQPFKNLAMAYTQ